MRMLLEQLGGSSGVSFGLSVSAKATVLLTAAALAGLALRRQSAAARHLLWTAALLGALAIPIVSRFIPSWPLTVSLPRATVVAPAAEAAPQPSAASRSRLDRGPSVLASPDAKTATLSPGAPVQAAPGNWWHLLTIVWAAGMVIGLLPLVVGLLNIGRISRHAVSADELEWNELIRTLSRQLGLRREVRLVFSNALTMPMTWGWIRPVVLLPVESKRWTVERRQAVLLHELAHVMRLDCLTQQIAQFSCAIYWFNPLTWWASFQMMVERERACDDLVLLLGLRPSEYAGHLLVLAREQRGKRGFSMVAVAMARGTNLEGRLRAILDPQPAPRRLHRWTALCGLLAAGAVVVSLASLHLEARMAEVKTRPALPETDATTVRGRVLDLGGKPVAGAHVVVLATLFRRLTCSYENTIVKGQGSSDDQGRFRLEFPRLPDGDKTIVVTAPGMGAGFENSSGSDQDETTIRLGPEQVVDGRLIDIRGLPAANVGVYVSELWRKKPKLSGFSTETPLKELSPSLLRPFSTDAQGRFTLCGLPPDSDVTLQVRDDRFALQDLRIATGATGEATKIVLTLTPSHILEGRVAFADTGEPAVGAMLHVTGYQSPTTTQSFDRIDGQAGPDGRFHISAPLAHHYGIVVDPPMGSPYFLRRLKPDATKGVRQQIDVTLERGILVRGRIHDSSTGQPVAGAIVVYRPKQKNNPMFKEDLFVIGGYRELSVASDVDGLFRIPVLPGRGHLLVKGPSPDFIPISTSEGELEYEVPSGARLYPVGLLALDLDASAKVADVSIPLRRGLTLDGRVVGPDGQAVPTGSVYSEAVDSAGFSFDVSELPIENGRFILRGLDPEKSFFALVFDSKRQLGASLRLSATKDGRPVTVTLHPCGSARTRFKNQAGKPVAKVMQLSQPMFGLEMVLQLSPSRNLQDQTHDFATTLVENIDHDRYETLGTDDRGELTFPSLIPGATYRVMAAERGWTMKKEFVAVAGQTVDLAEITILPAE